MPGGGTLAQAIITGVLLLTQHDTNHWKRGRTQNNMVMAYIRDGLDSSPGCPPILLGLAAAGPRWF